MILFIYLMSFTGRVVATPSNADKAIDRAVGALWPEGSADDRDLLVERVGDVRNEDQQLRLTALERYGRELGRLLREDYARRYQNGPVDPERVSEVLRLLVTGLRLIHPEQIDRRRLSSFSALMGTYVGLAYSLGVLGYVTATGFAMDFSSDQWDVIMANQRQILFNVSLNQSSWIVWAGSAANLLGAMISRETWPVLPGADRVAGWLDGRRNQKVFIEAVKDEWTRAPWRRVTSLPMDSMRDLEAVLRIVWNSDGLDAACEALLREQVERTTATGT
jgi:hypothetical protein